MVCTVYSRYRLVRYRIGAKSVITRCCLYVCVSVSVENRLEREIFRHQVPRTKRYPVYLNFALLVIFALMRRLSTYYEIDVIAAFDLHLKVCLSLYLSGAWRLFAAFGDFLPFGYHLSTSALRKAGYIHIKRMAAHGKRTRTAMHLWRTVEKLVNATAHCCYYFAFDGPALPYLSVPDGRGRTVGSRAQNLTAG